MHMYLHILLYVVQMILKIRDLINKQIRIVHKVSTHTCSNKTTTYGLIKYHSALMYMYAKYVIRSYVHNF